MISIMPLAQRSARSRSHLTAEMNKRMDMQREANYYMCYSEGLAMPTIHAEHANNFHHTSHSALSKEQKPPNG